MRITGLPDRTIELALIAFAAFLIAGASSVDPLQVALKSLIRSYRMGSDSEINLVGLGNLRAISRFLEVTSKDDRRGKSLPEFSSSGPNL